MSNNYKVKDITLAQQGEKNIAWAESQMGALLEVRECFAREKPFKNITIGMALHVTKETAALVQTLLAGGAEIAITGCNPLSTQDDVAAALAKRGVNVYAWKGETTAEYYENLHTVIKEMKKAVARDRKLISIDDGCDLVSIIHQEYTELIPHILAGTEETTTGVIRLRAMEKDGALKYPVVAVNDNQTKHLFDNYYGTGQSTIDGILRATSILLAGKRFVVIGYGHCGKGVAERARGMGSIVTVCEVDPILALQARMDGFLVMPMKEAVKTGDVFVTVTGDKSVITLEHMKMMKDGAILANSGHFDAEIDVADLRQAAKSTEQVRPGLEKFDIRGLSPQGTVPSASSTKSIYLCGEGRLVNLACAEGHPSIVMSLSFCGQSLAAEWGARNAGKLEPKVYILPKEIDRQIASLQLEAMTIKKDKLTREQEKYLNSWQAGT